MEGTRRRAWGVDGRGMWERGCIGLGAGGGILTEEVRGCAIVREGPWGNSEEGGRGPWGTAGTEVHGRGGAGWSRGEDGRAREGEWG